MSGETTCVYNSSKGLLGNDAADALFLLFLYNEDTTLMVKACSRQLGGVCWETFVSFTSVDGKDGR
jgi:hypothetical protein